MLHRKNGVSMQGLLHLKILKVGGAIMSAPIVGLPHIGVVWRVYSEIFSPSCAAAILRILRYEFSIRPM